MVWISSKVVYPSHVSGLVYAGDRKILPCQVETFLWNPNDWTFVFIKQQTVFPPISI